MPQLEVDCIRVTHPFAGRQHPEGPATPRLACIKPAASVHPEPVSNSPLLKNVSVIDFSIVFFPELATSCFSNTSKNFKYVFPLASQRDILFSKWDTKVMQPLSHCQILGKKKFNIFFKPATQLIFNLNPSIDIPHYFVRLEIVFLSRF